MPAHGSAEMVQRGRIGLRNLPVGSAPAGALASTVAIHFARLGREEGVAGPALAALERFQEESPSAAMQLAERGDRRVSVEHDLSRHRHDAAAAPRLFGESDEAVRHFGGAATR
jgi:hypothetical protein